MNHSRELARSRCLGRADQIVQDIRVYLRNGGLEDFLADNSTQFLDALMEIAGMRRRGLTKAEANRCEKAVLDEIDRALTLSRRIMFRPVVTLATSVEATDRKARLRL